MSFAFDIHDVEWAAAECENQKGGMPVANLLKALHWARNYGAWGSGGSPTSYEMAMLAHIVEPDANPQGPSLWRTREVQVYWRGVKVYGPPAPENIHYLMSLLPIKWTIDRPNEWFQRFQEIHPFMDGNRRVGSILWNLLSGTLYRPQVAPVPWADANDKIVNDRIADEGL